MLPLELIEAIALVHPSAWRSMLAIPAFARYSLSRVSQQRAKRAFVEVLTSTEGDSTVVKTLFCGKLHSFKGEPAVVATSDLCIVKEWFCLGVRCGYKFNDPYKVEIYNDKIIRHWDCENTKEDSPTMITESYDEVCEVYKNKKVTYKNIDGEDYMEEETKDLKIIFVHDNGKWKIFSVEFGNYLMELVPKKRLYRIDYFRGSRFLERISTKRTKFNF